MSSEPAVLRGEIHVRPCRVGLVFHPAITAIHEAVDTAMSFWGGMYFPFISPSSEGAAKTVDILAVDVLEPIDDAPDSVALAGTPGFTWRSEYASPLETGWLFADPPHPRTTSLVLPRWEQDDPLKTLFTIWFGNYQRQPIDGADNDLAVQLKTHGDVIPITPAQPVPDFTRNITPLELTTADISYKNLSALEDGPSFMVLDPQSPSELATFWNVRACGGPSVFPWPAGHDDRILPAAQAWLGRLIETGLVKWEMRVITPGRCEPPGILAELLRDANLRPRSGPPGQPQRWPQSNLLKTRFSRSFAITLTAGQRSVDIPMPPVMPGAGLRHATRAIVAAHIDIRSERGLGPARTFSVPDIRNLAKLFTPGNLHEAFHHPALTGHTLGVPATCHDVRIASVSPESVFKRLIEARGWNCWQGENGRFASQLVERFGGEADWAGNQPAIAAVLDKAAKGPHGVPLPALIAVAKEHQGAWGTNADGSPGTYSKKIVYELLRRKLLLPEHLVKCPRCGTQTTVRPQDLAVDLDCEMCSETFPLGFALGIKGTGKTDWVYRPAGNVPASRIREVMPIMAALSALSTFRKAWPYYPLPSPTAPPYALGLEVSGPHRRCEIDLTLCLNDYGTPVVIIGEAKSYHGEIDDKDLVNLRAVQQHLRGNDIECLILVATSRDRFTDDELSALRRFCAKLPSPLHLQDNPFLSGLEIPLAPILLTRPELTAPREEDIHQAPMGNPFCFSNNLFDLAINTCRSNLGEFDITNSHANPLESGIWQLVWR